MQLSFKFLAQSEYLDEGVYCVYRERFLDLINAGIQEIEMSVLCKIFPFIFHTEIKGAE